MTTETVPVGADVDIKRLRELCDKATPGPWRADGQWIDADGFDVIGLARFAAAVDAEFVAEARMAVPALLDEVEQLQARLADVREVQQLMCRVSNPVAQEWGRVTLAAALDGEAATG